MTRWTAFCILAGTAVMTAQFGDAGLTLLFALVAIGSLVI
jgi:hypothetical protein